MDARQGYAVVRDGEQWIIGENPARVITARGPEVFAALEEIDGAGFWVGFIAYDAGRAIEHVEHRIADDTHLPDVAFMRFDHVRRVDELPAVDGPSAGAAIELGPGMSSLTPGEHSLLVAQIHALLAAGECYQVNLTRRITFDAAPDPYALFRAVRRV